MIETIYNKANELYQLKIIQEVELLNIVYTIIYKKDVSGETYNTIDVYSHIFVYYSGKWKNGQTISYMYNNCMRD